uniref:T9SS type A sorting domain-containing protein n=1 Tax=Ignavibacterium album TaxID=591197 RepID=A0A7V2ZHI1_9BACT
MLNTVKSHYTGKSIIIIYLLLNYLSQCDFIIAQQEDTAKSKPVQYRRGIALQEGYISYDEYYSGKDMLEEKRRLFPIESTGVWTELHPRIPRVTYFGVHFVNTDIGWAVGNLGAAIKTTNGGNDWTISETNTTTLLLKVHSFDGQIVIAAGYNGMILRSSDGGETFEQIPSGTTNDLWGLQMLNDTLGFACGLNQTLLKTTDAGLTWQSVSAGLNAHYWAIDFLNEQYGMIACGGGKILKTTDGGNTWTEHQAGDANDLYAIDIIDSLHIAAAGLNGKNVYSSNGGINWVQNNRLQHDELNSIKFINADTGYTIGTYGGDSWGIRKTTNRGVTWFSPPSPNLSEWELELLPGGIGYSVGSTLWINKTTGGYDNWEGLFLNAQFVDVFFTDKLTGYAADGRYTGGPLYKTTDGGISWFGLPNFPSNAFTGSLRCVIFTDSVTGFGGGMPARIVKTTDAGNSWYVVNRTGLTDTIGLINRFFFINPTTGWAVTTRGGILKTTDAGENWFAQLNAGANVIFQSIHFVDSLYGWTANLSARPYKTTNGGQSWIQQTGLNIWESRDIYFLDSLTGLIVESNKLYKSTDAGVTWILNPDVTGFSIAARLSHYDDIIFVTGYTTYRTTNAGVDWLEYNEIDGVRINGLSLLGAGFGYAIGELGLVLKYYDENIPVELISFNSELKGNIVTLKWATATEINNQGFYVQRNRKDAVNWIDLAFINGAGTSTSINYYYFSDEITQFGKYKYRLKQIDFNGEYEYSNEVEVEYINKFDFYLSPNYPNPFNPSTKIDFNLTEKTFVRITLYDITGREIKKIIDEEMEAGNYTVSLNSEGIGSGVYFYEMITGSGFTAVNKLTILK